ncbi:Uncharacterised protein [Pseudescherichia vulneris]|nr:hypothetical protein [Pseudescherichia vulneris]STQ61170.1 Uncharacterised protein [Pseudescherichia vulneris]
MRTETINVDGSQNGIAIAILSTDDYLNANEAQSPLEVRGVTTGDRAGRQYRCFL